MCSEVDVQVLAISGRYTLINVLIVVKLPHSLEDLYIAHGQIKYVKNLIFYPDVALGVEHVCRLSSVGINELKVGKVGRVSDDVIVFSPMVVLIIDQTWLCLKTKEVECLAAKLTLAETLFLVLQVTSVNSNFDVVEKV